MLLIDYLYSIGHEDFVDKMEEWNKLISNGDVHVEKTEIDMKEWFLEDYSLKEVIEILEGRKNTDYGCWDYIEDLDLWVYKY